MHHAREYNGMVERESETVEGFHADRPYIIIDSML